MNAVCKTTIAGAILLLAAPQKSQAQYSSSPWEFGINAGTLVYQGDLSSRYYGFLHTLKPAIGLSVSRKFDSYFSLRGNLTFGRLVVDEAKQSSPAYHQLRQFRFSTPVAELSALLVWNVAGEDSRKLTYYFMAGGGLALTRIQRDWSRIDTTNWDSKSDFAVGLAADALHGTPRLIPVLPVGAGLRYQLSPAWSVNAEFLYRFTPTDYLDGFSQSANSKTNDRYYGLSLGISYRFGSNKYRCPKVN